MEPLLWHPISGRLQSVSVASKLAIWGVTLDCQLCKLNPKNMTWGLVSVSSELPMTATAVSTNTSRQFSDSYFSSSSSSSLGSIRGTKSRQNRLTADSFLGDTTLLVSAADDGTVVRLDEGQKVWYLITPSGQAHMDKDVIWIDLDHCWKWVSVGSLSQIWGLSEQGDVYFGDTNKFEALAPGIYSGLDYNRPRFTKISVGKDNMVLATDATKGAVFRLRIHPDGTHPPIWTLLPGTGADQDCHWIVHCALSSAEFIVGVDRDGYLWRYRSGCWDSMGGGTRFSQIDVGADGYVVAIDRDGDLFGCQLEAPLYSAPRTWNESETTSSMAAMAANAPSIAPFPKIGAGATVVRQGSLHMKQHHQQSSTKQPTKFPSAVSLRDMYEASDSKRTSNQAPGPGEEDSFHGQYRYHHHNAHGTTNNNSSSPMRTSLTRNESLPNYLRRSDSTVSRESYASDLPQRSPSRVGTPSQSSLYSQGRPSLNIQTRLDSLTKNSSYRRSNLSSSASQSPTSSMADGPSSPLQSTLSRYQSCPTSASSGFGIGTTPFMPDTAAATLTSISTGAAMVAVASGERRKASDSSSTLSEASGLGSNLNSTSAPLQLDQGLGLHSDSKGHSYPFGRGLVSQGAKSGSPPETPMSGNPYIRRSDGSLILPPNETFNGQVPTYQQQEVHEQEQEQEPDQRHQQHQQQHQKGDESKSLSVFRNPAASLSADSFDLSPISNLHFRATEKVKSNSLPPTPQTLFGVTLRSDCTPGSPQETGLAVIETAVPTPAPKDPPTTTSTTQVAVFQPVPRSSISSSISDTNVSALDSPVDPIMDADLKKSSGVLSANSISRYHQSKANNDSHMSDSKLDAIVDPNLPIAISRQSELAQSVSPSPPFNPFAISASKAPEALDEEAGLHNMAPTSVESQIAAAAVLSSVTMSEPLPNLRSSQAPPPIPLSTRPLICPTVGQPRISSDGRLLDHLDVSEDESDLLERKSSSTTSSTRITDHLEEVPIRVSEGHSTIAMHPGSEGLDMLVMETSAATALLFQGEEQDLGSNKQAHATSVPTGVPEGKEKWATERREPGLAVQEHDDFAGSPFDEIDNSVQNSGTSRKAQSELFASTYYPSPATPPAVIDARSSFPITTPKSATTSLSLQAYQQHQEQQSPELKLLPQQYSKPSGAAVMSPTRTTPATSSKSLAKPSGLMNRQGQLPVAAYNMQLPITLTPLPPVPTTPPPPLPSAVFGAGPLGLSTNSAKSPPALVPTKSQMTEAQRMMMEQQQFLDRTRLKSRPNSPGSLDEITVDGVQMILTAGEETPGNVAAGLSGDKEELSVHETMAATSTSSGIHLVPNQENLDQQGGFVFGSSKMHSRRKVERQQQQQYQQQQQRQHQQHFQHDEIQQHHQGLQQPQNLNQRISSLTVSSTNDHNINVNSNKQELDEYIKGHGQYSQEQRQLENEYYGQSGLSDMQVSNINCNSRIDHMNNITYDSSTIYNDNNYNCSNIQMDNINTQYQSQLQQWSLPSSGGPTMPVADESGVQGEDINGRWVGPATSTNPQVRQWDPVEHKKSKCCAIM